MVGWFQGRNIMVKGCGGREVFTSWWLEAESKKEPVKEQEKGGEGEERDRPNPYRPS